ncbi:Rap1a/Tai family immunity protein [Citrobacter freundii]|uniref:Rap1a/Tai family immunity protein n=1 Tax=Citrobacter freundii TaxID=546 RepID=UPI000A362C6C|nr:Rap1a/Tai family immunity protein [Citrobacter freundii]OUE62697.1 hypothetical protein AZ007_004977 [Citrobacter freundii]
MNMKRFLFFVGIFAFSFAVNAKSTNGNDLYDWSKSSDRMLNSRSGDDESFKSGLYMGYVTGAVDIMYVSGMICPPENATSGQMLDVVKLYLENHPERRADGASLIMNAALRSAFPCKK